MPISFKRAVSIIEDNDFSYEMISEKSGISTDTLTRLKNDKYVNLYTIERLAICLSQITGKKLQPNDLMEIKY